MKNKIKLKKYYVATIIVLIFILTSFLILNRYEYNTYTNNFNNKIDSIISTLKEKYPNVTDKDIIQILNSTGNNTTNFFSKYGIDIYQSSIIIDNQKSYHKFLIIDLIFLTMAIIALLLIFINYNNKKEKDINEIIKYIEKINNKNYELQIDSISEDELSILKNEIYKTTVMLKESAEISTKDKINLKNSLEDISHQLKTPLTSILIMLDNIIEDSDMDINVKNDFIRDIKRNVINIKFLVENILKLSKFDSNTIHFIKQEIHLNDILKEAIKNISTICDLRNINIELNIKNKAVMIGDLKWQIEAITNILKNAVEHSKNDSKIIINIDSNNIYSMIEIVDFGDGISKKDLPHIFERFYKGENKTANSIGIGLALAKKIIEEDNGNISVDSNNFKTKFTIKYFKF